MDRRDKIPVLCGKIVHCHWCLEPCYTGFFHSFERTNAQASWAEIPRERGARSGSKQKDFSGTAEAGALPKSSRAFARPGRVGDPSLHNHRDPSLHGQARGRGDRPYVDRSAATSGNRAGPFAIFKVVFFGHIQSFGFILSVYKSQAS